MHLTVRHVAKLLSVSEKTIYRWLSEGIIPAYRVHEQYRFNKAELLEWATARKIHVSAEIFEEPESPNPPPSLCEALKAGGIFYRLDGTDKPSVLRSVVEVMKLPEEVDREYLLQILLARETLGSTAIGDGIAIPHVRNPIVLHIEQPTITLCFLERPIEFGALDGQPVHTLFTIISPSVRTHLHILSRLSFALRDAEVKKAIASQATRQEILALVQRVESQLAAPAARAAANR
jgi:nitrogen PTS system EIIA component